MKIFAILYIIIKNFIKRILLCIGRSFFKQYDTNFIFNPFDESSFKTISIGSDVFIESGANF